MIILGNIMSLIGSVFMVWAGYEKNSKKFLILQCIQIGFLGIGNLILGGITGFVVNIISIIRNYICYKNKLTPKIKIITLIFLVGISLSWSEEDRHL